MRLRALLLACPFACGSTIAAAPTSASPTSASPTSASPTSASPTSASDETPPKRPLPDYDGRRPPRTTFGESLLWGPRVVAAPLWVTHEYLVRKPLGWLLTTAEKNDWPTKILDFFTFDERHTSGVIPTAYYDFGFRPSIGAYFFWDEAVRTRNAVRAHAAWWGADWISLAVADRVSLRSGKSLFQVRTAFVQRPDGLFAGLGPRAREADIGRYGYKRIDLAAGFDALLFRASTFRAEIGYRKLDFHPDQSCCGEPPIREKVAAGTYALPPGFTEGYIALYQRMELAIDSRRAPPASQTGVRVAVEAEHAADVHDARGRQWLRYGGQVGGFVDLDGRARVLGLVVSALFADPLSADAIPFTEQAVLGGLGPMRGYRLGRLVDRSALVATLQYEWPIWVWLRGTVHVATGNVFGARLDGFDPKLLRLSGGIGLRSVGSPDHQFEFLLGGGTETFEDGAKLTSVRVLLGATRGF